MWYGPYRVALYKFYRGYAAITHHVLLSYMANFLWREDLEGILYSKAVARHGGPSISEMSLVDHLEPAFTFRTLIPLA